MTRLFHIIAFRICQNGKPFRSVDQVSLTAGKSKIVRLLFANPKCVSIPAIGGLAFYFATVSTQVQAALAGDVASEDATLNSRRVDDGEPNLRLVGNVSL